MADQYQHYWRHALTGGESDALDGIDGDTLNNKDVATVLDVTNGVMYEYYLDSSSGAAEDSPHVISPDTNANDKRWILFHFAEMVLPERSTDPTVAANQIAVYSKELNSKATLVVREESNGTVVPVGDAFLCSGVGSNRNLRLALLVIESVGDGTVNLYMEDYLNGDDVESSGSPKNIAKGGSDTNWAYGAGGDEITIKNAAISGTHITNMPVITYNDGATALTADPDDDTGIYLAFYNATTGASFDLSGMAAGKFVYVLILYATSG